MVRAPAALDLGVSHILLCELIPELVDDPERPRAYNAVLQSEYARLAGMSPAALTAALEPYLPIVRVFALLAGWWGPAQRAPGRLNSHVTPVDFDRPSSATSAAAEICFTWGAIRSRSVATPATHAARSTR